MTSDTQAGFTIIESMLFLAISALVFVVGFAGIGSRLEQVRYSDSVRNLESDVETAFRNTDDGLNLRQSDQPCQANGTSPAFNSGEVADPGQVTQCAVAGVNINFDTSNDDTFTTDTVAVVTGQNSGTGFELFTPNQINDPSFDIQPYIKDAAVVPGVGDTYDLLWGLQYVGYLDGDTVSKNNVSVRYARSPISTQTFVHVNTGSDYSELTSPIDICFLDNSDRSATLTIQPNATISVAYQNGACDV